MRSRISSLLLVASLAGCNVEHDHRHDPANDAGGEPAPCSDGTSAIEHVTLISMEVGSLPTPDTTVIVHEHRVAWIGPADEAPIRFPTSRTRAGSPA